MNELVKRLSEKEFKIVANNPDRSLDGLKERIGLNHLHILFEETGTELGVQLDQKKCDFSKADLEKGTGKIHFEGVLTLNFDKVRCIADISVKTMKGKGQLIPIEDEKEYDEIIASEELT